MRKSLSMIMLIVFVLMSVTSAIGGTFPTAPAKIDDSFRIAINSITADPNNVDEYQLNGYDAYKIYYSSSVNSQLSAFGKTGNTGGYQALTAYYDYNTLVNLGQQPFQCVGFVKTTTSLPDTLYGNPSYWTKGAAITTSSLPATGTVIATFSDDNGTKFNGVLGDHTAIFVQGDSNHIYLLDQDGGDGYINIRAITFNSSSGNDNAGNYYVVEY